VAVYNVPWLIIKSPFLASLKPVIKNCFETISASRCLAIMCLQIWRGMMNPLANPCTPWSLLRYVASIARPRTNHTSSGSETHFIRVEIVEIVLKMERTKTMKRMTRVEKCNREWGGRLPLCKNRFRSIE
jgi:hypothetical protein